MDDRPLFSADEMLGSLARWLRIMGYDTRYFRDREDNEILETSQKEGRVLLTRDRELADRAGVGGLYVESDDLTEQLRQLSRVFSLQLDEERTRCTVCNSPLEEVGPEEVAGLVPEGALKNNDRFFRCTGCGKIYWKGSHWTNIRSRLRDIGN